MTSIEEQLATIVGDAMSLGYLEPKYSEVMNEKLLALMTQTREDDLKSLRDASTLLNADLAVAKYELEQLTAQRDAVRVYLGGTKVADAMENPFDVNASRLVLSVAEVADQICVQYPDEKIYAIKEMRAVKNLGLLEAKNAIEAAYERAREVKILATTASYARRSFTIDDLARQIAEVFPDKKISAIKELRSHKDAAALWQQAGGTPQPNAMRGNETYLGLKDAKDIMEKAYREIENLASQVKSFR